MRPLLLLLRASLAAPICKGHSTDAAMNAMLLPRPLVNLPLVLGLQNDLLGFKKDQACNNLKSAVMILLRDGVPPTIAYQRVVSLHNSLVDSMLCAAEEYKQSGSNAEQLYVDTAMAITNAMALWMLNCQRYAVLPAMNSLEELRTS